MTDKIESLQQLLCEIAGHIEVGRNLTDCYYYVNQHGTPIITNNAAKLIENWKTCRRTPYRPRTIRIGALDVPEPVRELLENGRYYYAVHLRRSSRRCWSGSIADHRFLREGRVHLEKEAAELHRKALIFINGGQLDD